MVKYMSEKQHRKTCLHQIEKNKRGSPTRFINQEIKMAKRQLKEKVFMGYNKALNDIQKKMIKYQYKEKRNSG